MKRRIVSKVLGGEETPLATMMSSFEEAARLASIDPAEFKILSKPDREIAVSIPVQLADGSLSVFDGWRVQHNMGLGPYCGPLRLAADTNLDDLRALAGWMTWECALLGVPFGGAAGGIAIDRRAHSAAELERAVRRYIANLLDVIGPERDVFTPEKARDELAMGWIMDTVSMHYRHTTNGCVVGKPTVLGGTRHHEDAIAQGLRVVLELARERFKLGSERTGPSVIIQGAGFVGGNLARLLKRDDWRVVGLADVSGGLFQARGLDVEAVLAALAKRRSLAEIQGDFEHVGDEELLLRPCDVLVPCAVANTIHSRNAADIQTKLVVEGQHGAVSASADEMLLERDIPVVPDILARAGGTVVGYFEWVQNRAGFSWQEGDVLRRLSRYMTEAWHRVVEIEREREVKLRTAAHIAAVTRVASADKLRGIYA